MKFVTEDLYFYLHLASVSNFFCATADAEMSDQPA